MTRDETTQPIEPPDQEADTPDDDQPPTEDEPEQPDQAEDARVATDRKLDDGTS